MARTASLPGWATGLSDGVLWSAVKQALNFHCTHRLAEREGVCKPLCVENEVMPPPCRLDHRSPLAPKFGNACDAVRAAAFVISPVSRAALEV